MRDNREKGRFELDVDGQIVFANYRRRGDVLAITHVEAPVPLRGTGAADRLMRAIVDMARREEIKLMPLCGYAALWLRRKPDCRELLA